MQQHLADIEKEASAKETVAKRVETKALVWWMSEIKRCGGYINI
jgi:hypothetical protein